MGSIFNTENNPVALYPTFISQFQSYARVGGEGSYCKITNISGFPSIHLVPENHKTGFATEKSQVHFTNNMLDEFNIFLIQV